MKLKNLKNEALKIIYVNDVGTDVHSPSKKRRKIENIITGSGCNDVIDEDIDNDIDNPNAKMKTPEKRSTF